MAYQNTYKDRYSGKPSGGGPTFTVKAKVRRLVIDPARVDTIFTWRGSFLLSACYLLQVILSSLYMAIPVLPPDIWLNIASFLPALVLCELISLNSTFFEIAMDYRYRQLSFAYFDNRMLRSISRLRYIS